MKMFLTTIALAIASPAMAQTAPAAACAPEHAAMGHCTPTKDAAPALDPHARHDRKGDCCDKAADGKMACCEKAKAAGKKMDCCEEKGTAAAPQAGHTGH